jgi:hypothetical protein
MALPGLALHEFKDLVVLGLGELELMQGHHPAMLAHRMFAMVARHRTFTTTSRRHRDSGQAQRGQQANGGKAKGLDRFHALLLD